MKRIVLFTITLITIVSAANAQITKGTKLLGGNLSTSFNKSDTEPSERRFGVTVNPALGFTYKDNHVIGFIASYGHSDHRYQLNRSESDSYGAGIYYRRYLTLGKGFYLFGQSTASYGLYDGDQYSHQRFNGQKSRQHSVGVSLYPGVAFAVNKRIHLEMGMDNLVSFGYNTSTTKTYSPGFHSEVKSSGLHFNTNANPHSSLSVGFRIALGKK